MLVPTQIGEERRRRLTHRALPALGLVVAAFLCGVLVGALRDTDAERTAKRFAKAWEKGDYRGMYRLLTPGAQQRVRPAAFERSYRDAQATATATAVDVPEVDGQDGDEVPIRVAVRTRIFGTVSGEVRLPMDEGAVVWAPHLVFPGVPESEELSRSSKLPPRARIVARGGQTIAEGPAEDRDLPLEGIGSDIAGEMGAPPSPDEAEALYARGFPRDALVGVSGLERVLNEELSGRPGGELRAGERVLASSAPRPARAVRTTIDTRVQAAAIAALGGRLGGVAALDPRTGEVRALTGIAFSSPQAPGSSYKIVTTVAALEARKVTPSRRFPVQTGAYIDGVRLSNAGGESCGGTFVESFAHSCNSVFAPLGVEVGAKKLVETSERFGFNRKPDIPGAVASTLPPAEAIRSKLELGATAIGQGRMLATPLELASISQTIAAGGMRTEPTLTTDRRRRRRERVTSRRIAATVRDLMITVTAPDATGEDAAIPGIQVAGKTGTAEVSGQADNAWFTAFAPARRPRLVIGVLVIGGGFGGDVAAPIARDVLVAALRRGG